MEHYDDDTGYPQGWGDHLQWKRLDDGRERAFLPGVATIDIYQGTVLGKAEFRMMIALCDVHDRDEVAVVKERCQAFVDQNMPALNKLRQWIETSVRPARD